MNNIKKIGLSALAGSLVAMSVNAAEMTVTGGASITFADYGADVTNNAWSSGDGLTFAASGELDNGLTVSSSYTLDRGVLDDYSVSIATEGMGTITFHGLDGSSALGAVDDVMPTAYEEPWFGVTSPSKVDGKAYDDMFQYVSPTVAGATVTLTYNQADTTNSDDSLTSMAIALSPEAIDGLTIGYATQDDDSGAATAHVSDTTMYVKYVYGAATLGYQMSDADSATDSSDGESVGYGISYAVSDELSISYGAHTYETPNDSTDKDQEASAISASYTSGGMTITAAMQDAENIDGSTTATKDQERWALGASFAF